MWGSFSFKSKGKPSLGKKRCILRCLVEEKKKGWNSVRYFLFGILSFLLGRLRTMEYFMRTFSSFLFVSFSYIMVLRKLGGLGLIVLHFKGSRQKLRSLGQRKLCEVLWRILHESHSTGYKFSRFMVHILEDERTHLDKYK